MLYSEWLVPLVLVAISAARKNKATFIVAFAYAMNLLFLSAFMDYMSGYTLYATCAAISMFLLARVREFLPALALVIYAALNIIASFDYMYFSITHKNDTIFYQYYYYFYLMIDVSIIALCSVTRDNGDGYNTSNSRQHNRALEHI